jgi:hypothetical protein
MEGSDHLAIGEQDSGLLRGRPFIHGYGKRPLLIKPKRVYAVNQDLSGQFSSQ